MNNGMRLVAALCVLAALLGCTKRSEQGARDAAATPAGDAAGSPTTKAAPGNPDEEVVDPFCGMKIKRGEAAASAEWNGKTYWFCLTDHRDAFLADPQRALCRLAGADAGPDCDAH